MTTRVFYRLGSRDEIKADSEWRNAKFKGIDKEYRIVTKRNGALQFQVTLVIDVADDSAILFRFRYPHCKLMVMDNV